MLWSRAIDVPAHSVYIDASTEEKRIFACAKTKTQFTCAVTAPPISAFGLATHIVQALFLFDPKFQTSSILLLLHRLVCARPGRVTRRPVFSRCGYIDAKYINKMFVLLWNWLTIIYTFLIEWSFVSYSVLLQSIETFQK